MNKFRLLLLDIGQHLTTSDVSQLKFACSDIIPAGRAEYLNKPHEIFLELERMDKLSEDNRDFLASIFERIGRVDMKKKLLGITDIGGSSTEQGAQRPRNPSLSTTLVTEELMDTIAEDVSIHWRLLGRKLGVKETQIQNIDSDYRKIQEKSHQVLIKWKQNVAGKATVQALMDAMVSAGRTDLSEKVEEMVTGNNPSGQSNQPLDMSQVRANLPAERDGQENTELPAPLQEQAQATPVDERPPVLSAGIIDNLNPDGPMQPQASSISNIPAQESKGKRLDRLGSYLDPEKYEVGELLGAGGYAKVYLCTKRENQQQFAVKIVDLGENDSQTRMKTEALNKEVVLLKTLDNPYVVKYCGTVTEHSTFAMFIEYMPGKSIFQMIRSKGPLPEDTVRQYTWQILKGLCYLHNRNITHRDVKAANILLDESGRKIKLTDFGISTNIEGIVTSTGAAPSKINIIASIYWTSPELLCGEMYGTNTDIWSLGCTVVEMLYGDPPLLLEKIENHVTAMFRISQFKVTPPEECSPLTKEFLERCFRRRKERPSSDELLKTSVDDPSQKTGFPVCCGESGAILTNPNEESADA